MIRIAIIDTHNLFRVCFKRYINDLPEFKVEIDISTLNEVPNDFNYSHIDLVIFEPVRSNESAFFEIQKKFSKAKVVILSSKSNRQNVMRFMHEGISGYYSKDDCPNQLKKAIVDIISNINYDVVRLGAVVQQLLIEDRGNYSKNKINFSPRELEVLHLVCLEKTNVEISELLEISVRTIESHRRRMIEKVDCRSMIGVILNRLEFNSASLPNDLTIQNQLA